MKALTAFTNEIDDVDVAVAEILDQLQLEGNLLSNSVGIISCYSEFIDSGVVKAISDAVPFEVIGCTTMMSSSCGEIGFTMLTIIVLTGDDVEFSTGLSDDLSDEQEVNLKIAYEQALAKLDGEPKMIMTYAPLINHVGGERIVDMLDKGCGGVPMFGMIAFDHTEDYRYARVIYNGEAYSNQLGMILISGDIAPTFIVNSIPEENELKQKAIVTKSEGNTLFEVNNMPFLDYISTLGIIPGDESLDAINTIPLLVNYNDGTLPVARVIHRVDENGNAVCGGRMPVGSTISFGTLLAEDVIAAAKDLVKEINSYGDKKVIFAYPCISRLLVLGFDSEAELNVLRSTFAETVPYTIAYAGGEICPTFDENGNIVNRLHNFTMVSCLF
jgi:Uncharacterized conserved protein